MADKVFLDTNALGITHLLTQNTADFSRYSTEGFVLLSVIP